MRAKEFEKIWMKIKNPTDRKIINAARKNGLCDKLSTIMDYTGLNRNECLEFEEKNL
jgi:hypothetical protein